MTGVYLPGNRDVALREVPVPTPGHGQVLVRMRASTICGSDLRAIYRGHVGPEPYDNVIAGHEPCGEIVEIGPGVSYFAVGDRVILHHIVGCGRCRECRSGSFITCAAAAPVKNAYGYGRDGGHADFLLAEESTCIRLADELSFVDGACVACGFGTAYEALVRANVSGRDAVLITGLGPVGMAAGLLARRMGAERVLGVDVGRERIELATSLGSIDFGVVAGGDTVAEILDLTGGRGCEVTVDCSGVAAARQVALESTRQWGRCMLVGEGNRLDIDVSAQLIHRQIAIYGSWVTSLPRMDELVELLVRWNLHPESIVTHRYGLADAGEAYATADAGTGGKVAIVMDA
jgi:2-desacetyl-2-hydroxyethyl bacteriochlorophyllide A dehydrogenase